MKRFVWIIVVLLATTVSAQAPKPELPAAATSPAVNAKVPELTEKERDTLIIKVQAKNNADKDVTIAQQAVALAQINAKAATDDAIAFLNTLQKDGFDFDYQTGKYTPKVKDSKTIK